MNQTQVIGILQDALFTVISVAAPMLITALAVGLIVSVFMAATQINEQTLAFVPKILAVFASLIICGPWMLTKLVDFTTKLFQHMSNLNS